jgi:hypothetical protein
LPAPSDVLELSIDDFDVSIISNVGAKDFAGTLLVGALVNMLEIHGSTAPYRK